MGSKTIGEVDIKATISFDEVSEEDVLEANISTFKKRLAEVRAEKVNTEAAKAMYAIYAAFKHAGFTQKQAWELLMKQLDQVTIGGRY